MGTDLIIHSGYLSRPEDSSKDLALLRLHREVVGIKPIEFAEPNLEIENGELLTAYGYGRTIPEGMENGEDPYPKNLMKVDLPLLDRRTALDWMEELNGSDSSKKISEKKKRLSAQELMSIEKKLDRDTPKDLLFVGWEKKSQDTCLGDSGGPLVHMLEGEPILLGTLSSGFHECGTARAPVIYVDIRKQVQWIKEQVEPALLIKPALYQISPAEPSFNQLEI